ncbi:MAG: cell division protein FtsL [Xanthomonadales bacterium]|nr:cell division protein FtsL [Xanthomonadales bacterium]
MSLKLLAFFALLIAISATGIAVVESRHEHRQLFVRLSVLEQERDELNIEFSRLQLEQATWADPSRIEQLARGPLGMKFPEAAELRVVNR